MVFQLVLETEADPSKKDLGDNVFIGDLPSECPCYALYYPGAMPDPQLEQSLRKLSDETGKNLFVNIGRLNDPNYRKIANLFDIERNPVIVLTAIAPLAAPKEAHFNTYVRLDSPKLLASSERTLECVQEVFTLFLRGKVAEAIAKGKWKERSELLLVVSRCIRGALGALWDFISERDISVSLVEGRFELKRSGE